MVPNVHMENWFEADILALTKSGGTWEIEIKTTVADYRKDAEKVTDRNWKTHGATGFLPGLRKHDLLASGCDKGPNRFSFAMPSAVVEKIGLTNIPAFAGVLSVFENGYGGTWVKSLRDPKILHRKTAADGTRKRMLVGGYYRFWKLLEKTAPSARFRDDGPLMLDLLHQEVEALRSAGKSESADALVAATGKLEAIYYSLNHEIQTIQTGGDDDAGDSDDLCGDRSSEAPGVSCVP